LVQLKHIDDAIARRGHIDALYRKLLVQVPGIRCLPPGQETRSNYAYFPVLVEPGYPQTRDALYQRLRSHGIYARRYFYPLISDFPMYRGHPSASASNLPCATQAAARILCLPIYPDLGESMVERVVSLIAEA
jgi:dTDP-4-amino-4,6-dideoxygalactose transaminase